ncbi:hypothetical protein [Micromonospora aurantiaca (nom. illeg.)]|uniref:hypothetical protein n=1 Tax=Micromonospora aurantiaca (nom. illeg.) TaxID=47850 RepID=UPI0034047837
MTAAPPNLLAVRTLLLTYLNVDKGRVRADDLEPAEVGIVGDADHRGGYHCGSNRVVTNDYSVVESSRDRAGLTLFASALDVGNFSVRSGGKTHNLRTFSAWLVAQCAANAADARDIREVIYSPDGRTVRRWDRLGRRTSGDSSHLFHTHISFFRDATRAGRDLTPLFRRYLVHIGLIKPPAPTAPATPPAKENDVQLTDKVPGTDNPNRTVGDILADLSNLRNLLHTGSGLYDGPGKPKTADALVLAPARLAEEHAALAAKVEGMAADIAAIREAITTPTTPQG